MEQHTLDLFHEMQTEDCSGFMETEQSDNGLHHEHSTSRQDVSRNMVGLDGLIYIFRPGIPELLNQ